VIATSLQHRIPETNSAQQQLRIFIEEGGYAPGDRLPSERELIRSNLRKGLDALEREGLIWRHVGKGTFVAASAEGDSFPALERLSQAIEAAANASTEAVDRLRIARDRAVLATTWQAYEDNDDAFHRSVAEATGNVLLVSLYDHLNQVHRAVAWRKVVRESEAPARDHPSFAEHDAILDAIEARDVQAAHAGMRGHLNSVSARLFGDD